MDTTLVALALTSGMVAAFNPCGFAMLPAYLGWFLAGDDQEQGGAGSPALRAAELRAAELRAAELRSPAFRSPAFRAVAVSAAVTAGFVGVFGTVGLAVTALSLSVQRFAPWLTIVFGVVLVALGVATLLGRRIPVPFLGTPQGPSRRSAGSMVLFGATYAIVSLSCTLPVFLGTVVSGFAQADLVSGLAVFLAYSVGMGLVLSALTMALALARHSAVRRARGVLAQVQRISGALIVVAGAYVTWYGVYEIRIVRGGRPAAGPVDLVTGLSGDASTWVQNVGGAKIALLLALVVTAGVGAGMVRVSRRGTGRNGGGSSAPSVLPHHAQEGTDPADHVEVAQPGDGGLHVALPRRVGDE